MAASIKRAVITFLLGIWIGCNSVCNGDLDRAAMSYVNQARDSGSHKVQHLCEKQPRPGGYPADKINFLSLRGYIAETYAKVMGGSPPSQPNLKPECTLSFC